MLPNERYDVIVVGAGFAGVSCALELQRRGVRTLLLDRRYPGSHCNSACLAPLHTIEQYGASSTVLEVYNHLTIHTPVGTVKWQLPVQGCIFDFRRFFQTLLADVPVYFQRTRVLGLHQGTVRTPDGALAAEAYVDASGWRAVLAGSVMPDYGAEYSRQLGVGVETELDYPTDGLHMYIDPAWLNGYAWAFGCRKATRFGVVSYQPCNAIRDHLLQFLHRFGINAPGSLHDTCIPFGLRPPVVKNVFVVGDAAGQALPTSAEGIRPALHAGKKLGELLADVFRGECDLEHAKAAYRQYNQKQYRTYGYMRMLQHAAMSLPPRLCLQLLRLLERPTFMQLLWRYYGPIFAD